MTSIPLVVSDVIGLFVAVVVTETALSAWPSEVAGNPVSFFLLLSGGLVTVHAANGLYPGIGLHGVVELRRSCTSIALLFGALLLAELLRGEGWVFFFRLLAIGALGAAVLPLFRAGTRRLLGRFEWWRHRIVVFGAGPAARRIVEYFASNPALGWTPVSVRDAQAKLGSEWGKSAAERSRIAVSLAQASNPTYAVVSLGENGEMDEEYLIRECAHAFPRVLLIPTSGRLPSLWANATDLGGLLGVDTGTNVLRPLPHLIKHGMDLALTSVMVVLCIPLVALIALAIKLSSPGPVFYGQMRIGRARRPFRAWKFRTMFVDADDALARALAADGDVRKEWKRTHKLRADARITRVGHFLRRTSLDELPQLWNVLCGEMSLVGPRPIVEAEAAKYAQGFGQYLSVRPGLTGLWQVSGRNRTTYAERVRLDEFYVVNWSPWLDLYILARTVGAVWSGDGAY